MASDDYNTVSDMESWRRRQQPVALNAAGGGGTSDGMEERLARLETHFEYVQRDLGEIRDKLDVLPSLATKADISNTYISMNGSKTTTVARESAERRYTYWNWNLPNAGACLQQTIKRSRPWRGRVTYALLALHYSLGRLSPKALCNLAISKKRRRPSAVRPQV